ncbi:putative membrane protein [Fructobacillus fructosus]|nr:putative membrane protein [Fructobacillus fructosus]
MSKKRKQKKHLLIWLTGATVILNFANTLIDFINKILHLK